MKNSSTFSKLIKSLKSKLRNIFGSSVEELTADTHLALQCFSNVIHNLGFNNLWSIIFFWIFCTILIVLLLHNFREFLKVVLLIWFYPFAIRRTLKPLLRLDPLEWNLTVMVSPFDTRAEKVFGTEDPQSHTLVYFLICPTYK